VEYLSAAPFYGRLLVLPALEMLASDKCYFTFDLFAKKKKVYNIDTSSQCYKECFVRKRLN
jgi:hypothetical protein